MKGKKGFKFLAKIIAVMLIAATLMCGIVGEAAAASYTPYEKSWQIANLVGDGYSNRGNGGPISITQGYLKKGSVKTPVFLVTMSGTDLVIGQSTELLTDLFSGFNLNNAYYYNVVNTIKNRIPSGANLILAGHSLGGMVAQQVAGNPTIKARYNVLNTVTFGSPLLSAGTREGTIKRLGDIIDPVPYLSINTVLAPVKTVFGLNTENGHYIGLFKYQPISAHRFCYGRSDVWNKYDVTGTKYGNAKLELDMSTRVFYPAPLLFW